MTNKIEKVYENLEHFLRYRTTECKPCLIEGWNARQPEINQLKKEIEKLKLTIEKLRRIP